MEMKDKEPKERFHLVKGSIAAQRCDAVVNAANNQLRAGSGVCGASSRMRTGCRAVR